jgi:hypothetical protein
MVVVLIFLLLFLGSTASLAADSKSYSIRKVEAAYLYNFLLFVRSPQKEAGNDLTICVLGDESFLELLKPIAQKKIRGSEHVLQVKLVDKDMRPADLVGCSLIFIGKDYKKNLGGILKRLQGLPILTVSDAPGFVQEGGMLGLVEKDGRLRWQINQRSVRDSGLILASQLLRSALAVVTDEREGR